MAIVTNASVEFATTIGLGSDGSTAVAYRDTDEQAAKDSGLGLLFSLNVLNGGADFRSD